MRTPIFTTVRVAVLVAASACSVHRTKPVPLWYGPNHELLVDATVSGKPLRLQVDTGSSTTILTAATCERLDIMLRTPFAPADFHATGAGGNIEGAGLILDASADIAGHHMHHMRGAMVDIDTAHGQIDGVIGMDVLGRYTTVIDLDKHEFALHREGDDEWRRAADLVAIAYSPSRSGHVIVNVRVGGKLVRALVDVGANRTFASPDAVAMEEADAVRVITEAVGADRKRVSFREVSQLAFEIGGVPIVAPQVLVAPLPIFRRLVGDGPAMIIGADALAGRRLVIDPVRQVVYLSRR